MKKLLWQVAAAMVAVCYTATADSLVETEDICIEPDHFLSYPLNALTTFPDGTTVTLTDQFAVAPGLGFTLGDGVRLLNPATKWHNGKISRPHHPNTHYLAVELAPVDTAPVIDAGLELLVFNQFDSHTLTADNFVTEGLQLLIPSVKKACPNGGHCTLEALSHCDDCFPEGDHYLCYPLVDVDVCPVNARFDDQFVKNRLVDGLIPSRLCNPADKTFNGVTTPANREETNHLLCYTASSKFIPHKLVHLLNQFGQQRGVVQINDEICVPSTKIELPAEEVPASY